MEDPRLIRDAQRGDALAMSELLDSLGGFVGRICGAIALDDGPDAAQDALILVFRDLRALRDPAALRAWVRRIATREALRHARRASRERPLPTAETAEETRAAEGPAPELGADIERVLRRLGPEQRAILVLRDLEGWSEQEAADYLGVAQGTVKSRLHRARAAFQKRWVS